MTAQDFIGKYDKEDTVVLLEGKRNVLDVDKPKLIEFGKMLAQKTTKMKFRSGNANGADNLFAEGVKMIDDKRLQLIVPHANHRKSARQSCEVISLETIDLRCEPEVISQSKRNKKTAPLIDKYVWDDINRITIKAAYIIRDTIKVIGTKSIMPATFAIFYDDLQNPKTGGTGHTMNICEINNIPYINQNTWLKWLNINELWMQ